ncbi:MAG: dihydrofolate reductase [Chitinophagaceae bacterium]|nr:dihydrofolate reductase [Chitinophagaceae bacterium]MCW5929378.1 dihydrofolate reductase [Chitinophagaceae bacterium]
MLISLIVAAAENNAIGKDNNLLWRLPNDMKFFKNTTWGMPVIMGRKTYLSLSGEPLPGRYNIVVSRQHDHGIHRSDVTVVESTQEALEKAKETDCKEVFIAGGGQIYDAYLPVADKIYITRVHAVLEGDTFFPVFSEDQWQKVYELNFDADEKHTYSYSFQTWVRKNQDVF